MFSRHVRSFVTSAIRRSEHPPEPGLFVPFSLKNKYKITAIFIIFFGSGFAAPFVILRHQMLK
ncbi:cytochrome c oxidase subunit 7C [Nomia melanderi]|uniref:cytochrome c oxidase subunit 7C n=1 Tax=Nomia melanderi TaxID=2448451 RepID=UPI0013040A25|nr:cytochrome c oxidase subunit 7C, mitochondrial-like [Nomia melanderi]